MKKSKEIITTPIKDDSARFKAELKHHESEEKYRNILESIEEGYFEVDLCGNITFVNPSMSKILGYSADELLGMNNREYTSAETAGQMFSVFNKIYLSGHSAKIVDYEIMTKNREQRILEVSASLMLDSHKFPIGFYGVARDVTERKNTEEALRKSEELYSSIFESVSDGIFTLNTDFHYTHWNNAMERISGVMREQVVGRNKKPWDMFSHLAENGVDEIMRKTMRGEITPRINMSFNLNNGKKGFTSEIYLPLRNTDGRIRGIVGVIRDITKQKIDEEKLKESEERYRLLAENIKDLVIMWDMNVNPVYISPSVKNILGYTPQEIQHILKDQYGLDMKWVITEESLKEFSKVIDERFDEDLGPDDPRWQRHLELELIRKDGSTVWTETTESFIRDKNNQRIGFVSISRDITERKETEEIRRVYEERLNQAQKMEAIGSLAGGIAHDFNNILAAIIGYSELIKNVLEPGSRERHNLEQILKAGDRAKNLVQQILTFSRQMDTTCSPVQIHIIVKEVLKLLRATIPSTIKIVQDIDINSGAIMANPTQIHQVVMNLCTNAYHAMEETSGTLTVSVKPIRVDSSETFNNPDLKPGPYVRLSVSDTGAGIDKSIVPRIFDPFFTTKGKGKGTGMGLAIVHGIVLALNGMISVDTKSSRGTSFHVYLPKLNDDNDITQASDTSIPGGKGQRILFIDDEKEILEIARDMLDRLGYKVTIISKSLDALKKFETEPDTFDLVITDQTMPGMTGAELATEIFRIRPQMPVILTSGFSQSITPELARKMGIKKYLSKPFTLNELATTVDSVLQMV